MGNPAFAGVDSGLHLNGAYRRQYENAPGVPVTMAFTADYYVGRRVGAGVNVQLDKAGLLSRSRVTLTYAYHLPLSITGEQQLHFGLSAGFRYDRLDTKSINADPNDPSMGLFNRRDNYFDGDFGIAYTDQHWTLQAALPNVAGYLKEENREIANSSTFYAAASYRFGMGDAATTLEPKVAFRGVRHYKNIVDFGGNLTFLDNSLNVFGLYHTSKNFTAGAGFKVKETVNFQLAYTSQTSGLRNYPDANFTLGLTINLFRNM
ncbi:PorP/SprF family type IX secretion system membrane protein [Chitinophaga sedimenti]|uniref:PorP/SprF family type IX secretion system membrane protein n=1 Tax=Chitinophaga sedimenti TaxID=2033606 RepID=UPI0027DF447E|nr:PorP/SprF family type IX secretion system membrane protein [Chitinophaga sedimenti]